MGPAADAFIAPVSTSSLITGINSPGNLELLAARSAQLSDAERDAALAAYRAPRDAAPAPRVRKAKAKHEAVRKAPQTPRSAPAKDKLVGNSLRRMGFFERTGP